MDPQLIDRIYESSFVPELWPGILDELAKIADARAGFLLVFNAEKHHWAASTEVAIRTAKPLIECRSLAGSQRLARLLGTRHSGFLVDYDLYSPGEMDNDPTYRDLLRPAGLGWSTGTAVPLPTGDNFAVVLEREYVRGPVGPAIVEQLDRLRPHLARGALISARLQLEHARAASEALALISLPALVLNEQGKVLAANRLIEALTGYVHWRAQDRAALKDGSADKLLREAIATIDTESDQAVRSFPVRDTDAGAAMVAHILPIRRTARDIFIRCAAVLVMTPVTLPQAPPAELVQSLFDLTPAEARVARSLAAGKTVEDIAVAGGVARSTIRTQLHSVLEKTGCNRQAEVVALLAGISPARG